MKREFLFEKFCISLSFGLRVIIFISSLLIKYLLSHSMVIEKIRFGPKQSS